MEKKPLWALLFIIDKCLTWVILSWTWACIFCIYFFILSFSCTYFYFSFFSFWYLELCNPYYPQCVLKNRNDNANSLFFPVFGIFSAKEICICNFEIRTNFFFWNNTTLIHLPCFNFSGYFGQTLAWNKTNLFLFSFFKKLHTTVSPNHNLEKKNDSMS